jgi:hypothetical protein
VASAQASSDEIETDSTVERSHLAERLRKRREGADEIALRDSIASAAATLSDRKVRRTQLGPRSLTDLYSISELPTLHVALIAGKVIAADPSRYFAGAAPLGDDETKIISVVKFLPPGSDVAAERAQLRLSYLSALNNVIARLKQVQPRLLPVNWSSGRDVVLFLSAASARLELW